MSLTVIQGTAGVGNPPTGVDIGSTVGVGQYIVVFVSSTGFGTGTGSNTWTISDNVNTGNYSLISYYPVADIAIYGLLTTSSGSPALTFTGGGGNYTNASCLAITGFSGTPSLDVGIQNTAAGNSLIEAINAASNFNNEVMLLGQWTGNGNVVVGGANWTPAVSANWAQLGYYAIENTPTTDNYIATLSAPGPWYIQLIGIYDQVAAAAYGNLPTSGPGISPNRGLHFLSSKRSSDVLHNLAGYSASFSFSYGALQVTSPNLSGVSYSVSQSYGALAPSGNLVGNSYSVSTIFGAMYNSTVVLGNIPGPGPGISPSSAFQFASPILDTSQFQTVLAKGNSFSFSQSYGKATGALALAGNSYSFSFSYGALQASAIGQMTGNSYSVSTAYGAITGLGLSNISGVSYSVSISYGALQAYILVPDVVGLTLQAAQNLLTALGFTTTSSNVYSTNWPAGDVTQQSPQPGSFANLGSSISLFISIGPFVRSPNANLGYKVTTRIFSLEEMVSREWGPEFRAPDHRIYVWSNNRAFDSTDIGTTGIYQKGTNTS